MTSGPIPRVTAAVVATVGGRQLSLSGRHPCFRCLFPSTTPSRSSVVRPVRFPPGEGSGTARWATPGGRSTNMTKRAFALDLASIANDRLVPFWCRRISPKLYSKLLMYNGLGSNAGRIFRVGGVVPGRPLACYRRELPRRPARRQEYPLSGMRQHGFLVTDCTALTADFPGVGGWVGPSSGGGISDLPEPPGRLGSPPTPDGPASVRGGGWIGKVSPARGDALARCRRDVFGREGLSVQRTAGQASRDTRTCRSNNALGETIGSATMRHNAEARSNDATEG
jgi:hypothetical protein